MTQLTIGDLTQIASDFLRNEYGLALEIPIKRNNRLKRSQGRYIETYNGDADGYLPNRIEIAGHMFKFATDEVIIDTLNHELVHYALCVKGEPYDDGDPHFEAELKRVCAPATGTNAVGIYGLYRCNKCNELNITGSKRIIDRLQKSSFGFTTRCCGAKLTYIKTVILDGTKTIDEYLAKEAHAI